MALRSTSSFLASPSQQSQKPVQSFVQCDPAMHAAKVAQIQMILAHASYEDVPTGYPCDFPVYYPVSPPARVHQHEDPGIAANAGAYHNFREWNLKTHASSTPRGEKRRRLISGTVQRRTQRDAVEHTPPTSTNRKRKADSPLPSPPPTAKRVRTPSPPRAAPKSPTRTTTFPESPITASARQNIKTYTRFTRRHSRFTSLLSRLERGAERTLDDALSRAERMLNAMDSMLNHHEDFPAGDVLAVCEMVEESLRRFRNTARKVDDESDSDRDDDRDFEAPTAREKCEKCEINFHDGFPVPSGHARNSDAERDAPPQILVSDTEGKIVPRLGSPFSPGPMTHMFNNPDLHAFFMVTASLPRRFADVCAGLDGPWTKTEGMSCGERERAYVSVLKRVQVGKDEKGDGEWDCGAWDSERERRARLREFMVEVFGWA